MEFIEINEKLYDDIIDGKVKVDEETEILLFALYAYQSDLGKIVLLQDSVQTERVTRRILDTYNELVKKGFIISDINIYHF